MHKRWQGEMQPLMVLQRCQLTCPPWKDACFLLRVMHEENSYVRFRLLCFMLVAANVATPQYSWATLSVYFWSCCLCVYLPYFLLFARLLFSFLVFVFTLSCFFFSLHPFWPPSSSCFSSTPDPPWLMVCYVYFGLQGDVGLPGPSGTPGDGSLRSEKTLTIYKGDKVTQQGKARSRGCSAFTTHTHTHTRMWWDSSI